MSQPIKIVYFGTPAYAVPALHALLDSDRFDVRLVVTQPDRPAGRGRQLGVSPVKAAATERSIPVYQPASLREAAARQPLVNAEADVFVVAAFGLIFGGKTLAIPKVGCVNLHASLLPLYRGASPISAAIVSGDPSTGVTLMRMRLGLDSGEILAAQSTPIAADETVESLTPKLADIGANLVRERLAELTMEGLPGESQDDAQATFARPLTKADGWIDWSLPANVIERHIRAMWSWPRAWTTLNDMPMQIHRAALIPDDGAMSDPATRHVGQVRLNKDRVQVQCGEGSLELVTIQLPGKSPAPASAWFRNERQDSLLLGIDGAPPAQPPMVTSA